MMLQRGNHRDLWAPTAHMAYAGSDDVNDDGESEYCHKMSTGKLRKAVNMINTVTCWF